MNLRDAITSALAILILVPLIGGMIGIGAWLYANSMTHAKRNATISTHVVAAPLHLATAVGDARPMGRTMSAESLYMAYCAQCHGPTGDGDGTQQLDRPARSFKEGGFSFGNTTTALYRSISNGIGGTPMPGFANTLSADDRRALAKYVQSLGPPILDVSNADMILTVEDTPQVIRGHLPALGPDLPEHPRGLLIGTTDGLSFEYRADDVRLLAVRQGDFVERTDWTGRGGSPLKPLGNVIDLIDAGQPEPMIRMSGPTTARLRGTSIMDGRATLRYSVDSTDDSRNSIHVEEWGEAAQLTAGSGYTRHMTLTMPPAEDSVTIRLPGGSGGVLHDSGGGTSPAIWATQRPDGQYRILLIETDASVALDESTVSFKGASMPGGVVELTLTTLILPEWNDDIRTALLQELSS